MTTIANLATGDPIDEAWVDSITNFLNGAVQSNTYTPTLGGMAVGTGGGATNSADYVYTGGPVAGDKGIIAVTGALLFGTSGATLPSAATMSVRLPAGFNFVASAVERPLVSQVSFVRASPAGTNWGFAWTLDADDVRLLVDNVAGTYRTASSPSATVPFAWAVGDIIRYAFTAPVVRV